MRNTFPFAKSKVSQDNYQGNQQSSGWNNIGNNQQKSAWGSIG